MRYKLIDLLRPHITGMTFVVKENKPFDPQDVRFLSSKAIVLGPNGIAHLIEKFWSLAALGLLAYTIHTLHRSRGKEKSGL